MTRKLTYSSFLFLIVTLTACGQTEKQKVNETGGQKTFSQAPKINPILIDYKSDTYKISLGDNYKKSDKIIDWHWAELEDDDGHIDSTGKDAFLYLGEPLINYNDGEWLPSLHITTDKNIITSFTCSVLFDLQDNPSAVDNFLKLLSNDIKQLRNDALVTSLRTKGNYEIINTDYVATFSLKKGSKYENDLFEYTITAR
jgi:hypothetical protein